MAPSGLVSAGLYMQSARGRKFSCTNMLIINSTVVPNIYLSRFCIMSLKGVRDCKRVRLGSTHKFNVGSAVKCGVRSFQLHAYNTTGGIIESIATIGERGRGRKKGSNAESNFLLGLQVRAF